MKLISRLLFSALLFCSLTFKSNAQPGNQHIKISLLTCGTGEELYSLFGHTALRIQDTVFHTDVVYNWGGFDYDTPNFYLKFMRGQLLYFASESSFQDFLVEYREDNRSVYEQVLNVDSTDKAILLQALGDNLQPDKIYYKYDFLLDNCTTRVRDILLKHVPQAAIKGSIVEPGTTSRDMIHFYLDRGGQPWAKLGIDILLGQRVDQKVNNQDAMFMPEFLMKGIDSTTFSNKNIVGNKQLVLDGSQPAEHLHIYQPLIFFSIISVLFFCIYFFNTKNKRFAAVLDGLLLYVTGLIGFVVVFMWFFTDHTVCKNNFNIAWALPTNFIAAFFAAKKSRGNYVYFRTVSIITILLIIAWFWLPQQMNIALLPVILLLLYRYIILSSRSNAETKPVQVERS